ncbi:DUF6553 family protein [Tessaracoccus sp.]
MTEEAAPDLHPGVRVARYGKNNDGDRFVGFWLALLIEARHAGMQPATVRTRRILDRFWSGKDVQSALQAVGDDVMNDHLRDAAHVYFTSCLTDPQYSSTMWRMNRIDPEKLRDKMARETANTLALLADSAALQGWAGRLPALLTDGFLEALAPQGAKELAEAVASNPSAQRAMELTAAE